MDTSPTSQRKTLPSRVKVVVRVRPPIPEDDTNSRTPEESMIGARLHSDQKRVTLTRPLFEDREFRVDSVLGPQCSQEDMYVAVAKPIVDSVLQGFNGTVIAYGQTGSGKTFTIFGPEETVERSTEADYFTRCGVIPRAIEHLFEHIHMLRDTTEFRVSISCLEMYMEYVMDLFDLNKTNLAVREDPKSGVFVDQMTHIVVQSPHDCLFLVQEAFKNRAISRTYMNKTSSRSHVICFFTVEQREKRIGGNQADVRVKRGLLTIIDLAGSERVSKSRSDGQRLKEAKLINKSLCALGNCVAALSERKNDRHIPYRDSKLTRILTDSLGGNTKTCLCATICPTVYNYEESTSTLLFATRAMAVRNHAKINVDDHFRVMREEEFQETPLEENNEPTPEERRRSPAGGRNGQGAMFKDNEDLASEVRRLRAEADAVRSSYVPKERLEEIWQTRERELVAKFTRIIQHMQSEIRRQGALFESIGRQQGLAQGQTLVSGLDSLIGSRTESDVALEQLVAGLLSIPSIRSKLSERLVLSDEDASSSPSYTQTVSTGVGTGTRRS